jgi:hypothetical protein
MNIKIFMATANSYLERELLQNFGAGIDKWIQENLPEEDRFKDIVRIGRWANVQADVVNTLEYEYSENYTPCDVAVMSGSWKPREKGHHLVRNSVAQNSKCFVCIETPLLGRKTSNENTHWRVGVNGFLNQSASWPDLDSARGKTRLDDLGIEWSGWQNNIDGHIVLALQLPGDASLRGTDINDWAFRTIRDIRKVSDRPIVVRNHPLASMRAFGDHEELARKILLEGISNIKFSDGAEVALADDLADAYCTVTYTSGLAIDSIIAGIPTVACDTGNFAWSISTNFVKEIEDIKMSDPAEVNVWLEQLALCQWTLDEMYTGEAWLALLPVIETAKK